MKQPLLLALVWLATVLRPAVASPVGSYAVVISPATLAQPEWATVAHALQARHSAQWLEGTLGDPKLLAALRQLQPRYVGFVARPEEIDETFVAQIHQTARVVDGDPYEDFLWGIVTGYTAQDALRLVQAPTSLVVSNVVSLTGLRPEVTENLLVLSDARAGNWLLKEGALQTNGTARSQAPLRLLNFLVRHDWDAFLASGHASPFNVELSFGQGALVCSGNRLFLLDAPELWPWLAAVGAGQQPGEKWYQTAGCGPARAQWAAQHAACQLPMSDRPKVFLGAGCCLVGNPRRTADSLVITLLSAGGFNQCVGYTLEPSAGDGGWGTLRLWESLAGQLSLAEAGYLANQNVIDQMVHLCPEVAQWLREEPKAAAQDGPLAAERVRALSGLAPARRTWLLQAWHDLDGLAFYGDPRWEARLAGVGAKVQTAWEPAQGGWQLRVSVRQAGGVTARFLVLLPSRAAAPRVVDAAGLAVTVTDEFVVLGLTGLAPGQERVVRIASGEGGAAGSGRR